MKNNENTQVTETVFDFAADAQRFANLRRLVDKVKTEGPYMFNGRYVVYTY